MLWQPLGDVSLSSYHVLSQRQDHDIRAQVVWQAALLIAVRCGMRRRRVLAAWTRPPGGDVFVA